MSRIPYPLRHIKAIASDIDGVLSTCTPAIDADGRLMRTSNIHDVFAIRHALEHGSLSICLLASCDDKEVEKYYSGLGIETVLLNVRDKREKLMYWLRDRHIHPSELAYIGCDLPDRGCMALAGLPIATPDSAHECLSAAKYVTDAAGGQGVYREIIEQILADRHSWFFED